MRAVFLDRDGVINEYPGDFEYVKDWSEFSFIPGAKEAIKKIKEQGYHIFVISNQAGISKGIYPLEKLNQITENMLKELKDSGVCLDGVFYCLHQEKENCSCRKPKSGLIEKALTQFKDSSLDTAQSYFIGDTIIDIQTGKAANLKTILVFSGKEKPINKDKWKVLPDFTARDLAEAAQIIIQHNIRQ